MTRRGRSLLMFQVKRKVVQRMVVGWKGLSLKLKKVKKILEVKGKMILRKKVDWREITELKLSVILTMEMLSMTMEIISMVRITENKHFSDETVLQVNLAPLHLLDPVVVEVYKRWNRTFLYELRGAGGVGLFVSHALADYRLGAAVKSMRAREEENSRLPVSFWNQPLSKKAANQQKP